MSDLEHKEPGAPQVTGGEGEAQQREKQPEEGGTEAERAGPNWWELRPDPEAYADAPDGSAGVPGGAGTEQIVTGSWSEGKTIADAQLLQSSAQTAAGRVKPGTASTAGTPDVNAAASAVNAGAGSIVGGSASNAGGSPSSGSSASNAGGSPSSGDSSGTGAGVAVGDAVTAGSSTLGERLAGSGGGGRAATIARRTNETDISLTFSVDGSGRSEIETDVPFLNHMLDLFTKHGQFDLRVAARGDVDIDDHHTVEDIGICLGQTLREALGDKRGIKRYASVFVPMDEALAQVVIDISNRPHFEYRGQYPSAQVGSFQVELVHEFLWKLALEARITLHVIVHYGLNTHHMIEAVFKALGRAIDEATSIDPRVQGVPSTKGVL